MTDCHDLRTALGAYALGALEPHEQDAVEAHLAGCPDCLRELTRLTPVVDLLSTVSAQDLAPDVVPPDLFGRITAAVAAAGDRPEQPAGSARPAHRTRRWLVAVAAAVVLLGGGVGVGAVLAGSSPSGTSSVSAGGVRLAVDTGPAGTGTALAVTVSGLPPREHCQLRALAADGTMHDAGTWDADYDGTATLDLTTVVPPSQLRGLTLFGNGERLLELNV